MRVLEAWRRLHARQTVSPEITRRDENSAHRI